MRSPKEMCCPKAKDFYSLPSRPSTHILHKHFPVFLRKQATIQIKETENQVILSTFESESQTLLTWELILILRVILSSKESTICLNGLNSTRNDLCVNVLTLPRTQKSNLVRCLTHLISSILRRLRKCSCSFVLFSPWNLIRTVKNDSDRHLREMAGKAGRSNHKGI